MHNIHFFINGLLIGSLLCNVLSVVYIKGTYGTLKIDHSNPEKDIYRFEINNFDDLSKKKRIILKVDNNADLSQK